MQYIITNLIRKAKPLNIIAIPITTSIVQNKAEVCVLICITFFYKVSQIILSYKITRLIKSNSIVVPFALVLIRYASTTVYFVSLLWSDHVQCNFNTHILDVCSLSFSQTLCDLQLNSY